MQIAELRARANEFKRFRARGVMIALPFDIRAGELRDFPNARDVAFTQASGSGLIIYFHPQVDTRFSDSQALGVLYHELGHVFEMSFGRQVADAAIRAGGLTPAPSEERRADQLAYAVFGKRVNYDDALIQTVQKNAAHFVRPGELG